MATLHIPTIILLGLLEALVNWIVFKYVGIRRLTFYITTFSNFIIPIIWLMLIIQSDIPFIEKTPIVANIFVSLWTNLINFVFSSLFGLIISLIVYTFTGKRPESIDY